MIDLIKSTTCICLFAIIVFTSVFIITHTLLYWNVIVAQDIINAPKRLGREVFMSIEEQAEVTLKEYQKLRKFICNLDLPLDDRQGLLRDLEYQEKRVIRKISDKIEKETLERIRGEYE